KMSKMQKARFYKEYGSLHVLQFGDILVPGAGPGKILVKVVSSCDVCVVVEEVGEGVKKVQKGDEVYSNIQNFTTGMPKQCGTLTEYTIVEQDLVSLKPNNLSLEEAT
ncbi:hypothetical protein KI387_020675, partial [Taxus chinensis]